MNKSDPINDWSSRFFWKRPTDDDVKTVYQLDDASSERYEPRLSIDDLEDVRCNYCNKWIKRGSSHYTNRHRVDTTIYYTGTFCSLRCWGDFVHDIQ